MNFVIAISFHLNEINVQFSIIEMRDRQSSKLMHKNIRMN